MPRFSKPTLRDVASAAHVSLAAASMALNHHPNIPVATRRAVELAAERLGYEKDTKISELMAYLRTSKGQRHSETLAFISSHSRPTLPDWQRPYLAGATAEAERLGYKLDYFWCEEPGMTKRRFSDILYGRGIRGLLIAPLLDGKSELPLSWARFTAVALGYFLVHPRIHRVLNHHYNTMMLAVEKLSERGYRRIALAMQPVNQLSVNNLWKAGYITAHEVTGLTTPPLCYIAPFDPVGFYRWFRKFKPDAIIANDARYYTALHKQGLDAPKDFGIVSLTVKEDSDKILSRVDQNHADEGATAIRLVVAELLHNEVGVPALRQTVMLESTWVEGETIRPATETAEIKSDRSSRTQNPSS